MKVLTPLPTGSGAIELHRALASHIEAVEIRPYSRWLELFPPAIGLSVGGHADLVHTAPDHAAFLRQKAPLIATFHGYVLDKYMRQFGTALQRLHWRSDLRLWTSMALKKATMVTAVSQFVADLVRQDMKFDGEVRVIPNGVCTERFIPTPERRQDRKINILFCGNPSLRKGAHLLPDIAQQLDHACTIICATGRTNLPKRWRHHKLIELGPVAPDKMPEIYRHADILLMPTFREGFGLAVAEAMACGLPVVASNCSTMPELVVAQKGGILCPPGDITAFASALNELAEQPDLRKAMGQYNRQRIESSFSLLAMTRAYRCLYEEVLDS